MPIQLFVHLQDFYKSNNENWKKNMKRKKPIPKKVPMVVSIFNFVFASAFFMYIGIGLEYLSI